jgi:hypothetical protein
MEPLFTGPESQTHSAHGYIKKMLRMSERQTGVIDFDGQASASPAPIGAHAVMRPTCNCYPFWQFQRAPGDWVVVNNLKK